MKIHIDTADEKEKAQAKNITKKPVTKPAAKTAPSNPAQSSGTSKASSTKPNMPKSPPKEPKPPKDVVAARKRQTDIVKSRQNQELSGHNDASRENAGVGFWPTPFL